MLSLFSFEAMHTNAPASAHRAPSSSEMVSRVLDCAEFYRWRDNCDGSRTAFFILRKTIQGALVGTVMPLADLHQKLASIPAR